MKLIDLCKYTCAKAEGSEQPFLQPTYLSYCRRMNNIWEVEVAQ